MDETRRHGTVTFVGILFLLAGAFNLMMGIVILTVEGNVGDQAIQVGELPAWGKDTWGVYFTIVGAVQLLTSLGVFARAAWGQALGILIAALGLFAAIFFHQAQEGWAFTIAVIDIIIIYVLSVHGEEFTSSA